ncbi:hypothetical protein IEQ34_018148 [Dendrobium chrysotoxum]|uniref:DUF4283 domain-containing protein n=1 Tax=Dendrobium chrysotoxum TaxID=161865 RepID=A0AAV7FW39_DENCH|nr:hypothetical protein IEQ34_018148 [Dendrobium chrysotoxum]
MIVLDRPGRYTYRPGRSDQVSKNKNLPNLMWRLRISDLGTSSRCVERFNAISHEESKELEEEEKTEELKTESIPLKAPPRLRVLADHLAYEGAVLSKEICRFWWIILLDISLRLFGLRFSFFCWMVAIPSSSPPNPWGNPPAGSVLPNKGFQAILMPDEDIVKLVSPYQFTLVENFLVPRPNLDVIHSFFKNLKLSYVFSIGFLDARHVAIQLSNEFDYSQVFARSTYYIKNCQMRLLMWIPEPPIDPI